MNAIAHRSWVRCLAKASVSSSTSSLKPARAVISARGGSTSVGRATRPTVSRGGSLTKRSSRSSRAFIACRCVTDKQFAVRDLVINAVDFSLRLPSGDVFVAETAEGVTALVLLGEGTMIFTPAPSEERLQLKLFAGTETLETPFTAAYVRINPYDFNDQLKDKLPAPTTPDPRVAAAGAARVRRRGEQVVQPRPARSQPRQLVAAAAVRRFPGGGADAALRHADLRAIDQRAGRRDALSSRPQAQHRGLRERDEVEQPRPVLQRRRPRRIRRRRLHDRRELLTRARVARRDCAPADPREVVRAGGAHAAAG